MEQPTSTETHDADEQRELRELRAMIGNDDLDRLRPTGAGAGVSFPGKEKIQPAAPKPAVVKKAVMHDEGRSVEFAEDTGGWDSRPFRQADYEVHGSARRQARRDSARDYSARHHTPYVSKRAAIENYKREMANHTAMWREQRAVESMEAEYRWDMYLQRCEWQDRQRAQQQQLQLEHRRQSPPQAEERGGKAALQDEDAVVGDVAPKPRRRVGASQTSRGNQERGRRPQGTHTSRGKSWVPPSQGWNASPMRSTPYALRGTKPITNEPWAKDAEALGVDRGAEKAIAEPGVHPADAMTAAGSMAIVQKRGVKKAASKVAHAVSSVDNRPEWEAVGRL